MVDIIQNCINWNKKEFYRAINEERWSDAARFKGNIERIEEDRKGQTRETGE